MRDIEDINNSIRDSLVELLYWMRFPEQEITSFMDVVDRTGRADCAATLVSAGNELEDIKDVLLNMTDEEIVDYITGGGQNG